MELKKLRDGVYYINARTNIGVITLNESDVLLIDTGIDESVARKILKILKEKGLNVKYVINTHSHADHIGGNSFIYKKTQAKIFVPEKERSFVEHPYLEPFYLFSSHPLKKMRNKFLMAKPSTVSEVIKEDQDFLTLNGVKIGIERLRGHTVDQIGVVVEDIFFCADSVINKSVIDKYKIPYAVNIEELMNSFEKLKNANYSIFLPSHSEPVENIEELIEINKNAFKTIEFLILRFLEKESLSIDSLQKRILQNLDLNLTDVDLYFLTRSTILAYLSYLEENNEISYDISNNELLFFKK